MVATVGGENKTTALRWQFDIGGTAINILIDNPTDASISVTKLQARGTPVITYQEEQVQTIDVDSIYDYGRIPLPPISARFINTEAIAQGYADQLARRYNTPTQRYETIVLLLRPSNDNLSERALAATVGSALHVTNTTTGHNRNYVVVGESHSLTGRTHRVTLTLRPANRAKVWILGESVLGTSTILAF